MAFQLIPILTRVVNPSVLSKVWNAVRTGVDYVVDGVKYFIPGLTKETVRDLFTESAQAIVGFITTAGTIAFTLAGKTIIEFSATAYKRLTQDINKKREKIIAQTIPQASKKFEQYLLENAELQDKMITERFSMIMNEQSRKNREDMMTEYLNFIGTTLFQLEGCILGLQKKGLAASEEILDRYGKFKVMYFNIQNMTNQNVKIFDDNGNFSDSTSINTSNYQNFESNDAKMTKSTALMRLFDINEEILQMDRVSAFVFLDNAGLPLEINTRLQDLWDQQKTVHGMNIHVGRIILFNLIEFAKRNKVALAMSAIAVAASHIILTIPVLGSILGVIGSWCAPIAASIGATIGARIENGSARTAGEALYDFTEDFFRTLREIFTVLKHEFLPEQVQLQGQNVIESTVFDVEAKEK